MKLDPIQICLTFRSSPGNYKTFRNYINIF